MKAILIIVMALWAGIAAQPQTAAWTCRPEKLVARGSIVFDASPPQDRDGGIVRWEWDFGDHSRAWTTAPVWSHVYHEPGRYPVTLTVTDRTGSTSTATSIVAVKAREFMITFDDGPASESTPYILEQLRRIKEADGAPVKAGFFVVGQDKSRTVYHDIWQPKYGIDHRPGVLSHPELVRQIAKEGHIVAIHTQHHPDLDQLPPAEVEREILDCYQAILGAGVTPPKVLRSPRLHDPKTLPPALAGWRIVRGELTKDYLPLITEDEVIDNCRKILRTAPDSPVVLTFHDFRGLPGHRLDFVKIVNTLTEKDHFVLIDFDADGAVAASRYRAPNEQTSEDLQDLLQVWRQRLSPSRSR
ncbi:MAG: PKD domain-containing protein [Phycisphaerae bacterium]|nr:PKD domain-containing protein [Phycisphaerae bacterium]